MTIRRSRMFQATASAFVSLALGTASAIAADVVVQPNTGSGLVVTDANGSQIRLRVNEDGEVIIPVLVNGAPRNLPACVSTTGQLGPCAPGAVGGGPQGPAGPPGPAGATGPTGPQGPISSGSFALPYAGATVTSHAAFSVSNTEASTGVGIYGLGGAGSGMSADSGAGVWGDSSASYGVFGSSKDFAGVYGKSTGPKGGAGVLGESASFDGVHGYTSSTSAVGVAGFADQGNSAGVLGVGKAGSGVAGVSASGTGASGISTSGFGVFGHSDSNYAFVTDGSAQQTLSQGGWVKAMVQAQLSSFGVIFRCFNSQLPASASSAAPCGFKYFPGSTGSSDIDFGFPIYDRFVSATISQACYLCVINISPGSNGNSLHVQVFDSPSGSFRPANLNYYLIVY